MDGQWITTDAAAPALASAAGGGAPLALAAALEREFGLTPEQRAAVLTQTELRARAAARWGTDTHELFFTRDGLEQASRPAVATWRAHRLAAAGVRTIADLGCGLGLEARAFATAGLTVTAVERDPETAAYAAANLRDLPARVLVDDVTTMALPDVDALFVDPARRDPSAPRTVDGRSGQRMADPDDWSPPWSWVCGLAHPRIVAKVAPGIAHARIPDHASATWVQCDGDLVEASVWFNELRNDARTSAIAISNSLVVDALTSNDEELLTIAGIADYVYDVHGAVTRAGLVTQLAARLHAHRLDDRLGFLTSSTFTPTPFATAYRVIESLAFDTKCIVDALRKLDAGNITIVKRAFAADTEQLRKQWVKKLSGHREYTVVLTRIGADPRAFICEPALPQGCADIT